MSDRGKVPRRSFFREGLRRLVDVTVDALESARDEISERLVSERAPSLRTRPPGARPEPAFLERCTRCDDCVAACPAWAIRKERDDEPTPGYPMLEPETAACAMCDDPLPCVAACEPGALVWLSRESIRLGLAVVEPELCARSLGGSCEVCRDYCPIQDLAIRISALPVVSESCCTGCGVCAALCPERAIEIRRI